MPRSRSGSFYCPMEPAWDLSITQKAAISIAPAPESSPRCRRHVRTPSLDGAIADEPTSVTFPPTKLGPFAAPLSECAHGQKYHPQPQRYPWTPQRPSPLRRQTNAAGPLCPSALWTTHTELLPLYGSSHSAPYASTSCPSLHKPKSRSHPLCQSVLKNAFLSGPMGEKAHMYGLRVAWCVFGDIKEALAKDIFVSGSSAGYTGRTSSDEEHEHVERPRDDALSPPPRSRLRREPSFVWDVQAPVITAEELVSEERAEISHFDHLSSDESDSEYSEASDDEDTESAESDDLELDLSLDDEEEIERDILAMLHSTGLTTEHDREKIVDGERHWEVMSYGF